MGILVLQKGTKLLQLSGRTDKISAMVTPYDEDFHHQAMKWQTVAINTAVVNSVTGFRCTTFPVNDIKIAMYVSANTGLSTDPDFIKMGLA